MRFCAFLLGVGLEWFGDHRRSLETEVKNELSGSVLGMINRPPPFLQGLNLVLGYRRGDRHFVICHTRYRRQRSSSRLGRLAGGLLPPPAAAAPAAAAPAGGVDSGRPAPSAAQETRFGGRESAELGDLAEKRTFEVYRSYRDLILS